MLIWCRRIIINKPEALRADGPLLLACNHPNSFLDSVILDTIFRKPVWSLARGDAFKKPLHRKLLTALKILPVYRTSEGVENLTENYKTFEACVDLFKKNGIITIFSEGKCINEWHLRPLKKGTARLAIKAWEENIPLQVLPVGINYSSFSKFGKVVVLNFGTIIKAGDIDLAEPDGVRHAGFNQKLKKDLERLVWEIPKTDRQLREKKFNSVPVPAKKILLSLPALVGWFIHYPLYLTVKRFTWKRTHDNDHYDSVINTLLMLLYPFYLLLITGIVLLLTHCWWFISLLLLLPFTAWAAVQVKNIFE